MFTKVKKLRSIDVKGTRYLSAALVEVHGKGSLTFAGEVREDYTHYGQILLNGKPVMQGEYPECPTCSAMLARGYGIENINCPELVAVRDRINGHYTGLDDAIDAISPLLGLLDSGYYIIADCPQYPTYGDQNFFCNAPDNMTNINAACSSYYVSGMMTVAEGTPAYLYPSQSNSCLKKERIDHYRDIISRPDAPRAIALYDYGFVSVLLDGHHKAAAAAQAGVPVPCLVIIPTQGRTWRFDLETKQKTDCMHCFADILIPEDEIDCKPYSRKYKPYTDKLCNTNIPYPEGGMQLGRYPTAEVFAAVEAYSRETAPDELTDEQITKWAHSDNYDDGFMLRTALMYLAQYDHERAERHAKAVMRSRSCDSETMCTVINILLSCRDNETEQLFIDYLVDADKHSAGYEAVLSYF
ncbi:MAG: hypothetical protein ILP19_09925 [Oscillospiraceae bacterium]|nr:hypothetical protein [Oscillospiraceae bacterium]